MELELEDKTGRGKNTGPREEIKLKVIWGCIYKPKTVEAS